MSYDQVPKTPRLETDDKPPDAFPVDCGFMPPPLKRSRRYRPNLALSPDSQTRELYEFAKHPDFVRTEKKE